ncbi:MAG: secondary thiamine-phosphate synthase enzyme YjbQ [Microcystaceae cyanobacterium]
MLAQHQQTIKIPTQGKSFHPLTHQVQEVVGVSGIQTGLCTIFVRHTSASLIIQENADPDVQKDLINFYDKLAPMSNDLYIHCTEGKDDMPSHIKSSLTNTNLTISIKDYKVQLGTWQGIFLFEHRLERQKRKVFLHIIGEK